MTRTRQTTAERDRDHQGAGPERRGRCKRGPSIESNAPARDDNVRSAAGS